MLQHKTLCDQFKNFLDEHRPSPDHRRVIFFPHHEERPRFVWLKYRGGPKCMNADYEELKKLVGQPECIGFFDSDHELQRQYNATFWMQTNAAAAAMLPYRSLRPLLGPLAERWRGPIVCMAPTKYNRSTDWDDYDAEDKGDEYSDTLIPFDLDTTSLAMHVAFLRFRATDWWRSVFG